MGKKTWKALLGTVRYEAPLSMQDLGGSHERIVTPCSASRAGNVLVLGVEPQSLINFRKDLIAELKGQGHTVIVASLEPSGAQRAALESLGAEVRAVSFSRTGMNPFRDLITLFSLVGLFRETRPDVAIAYTSKPVIYGALAAFLTGGPRFVAMITGLGYAFVEGPGTSRRIARLIASSLYRVALKCTDRPRQPRSGLDCARTNTIPYL